MMVMPKTSQDSRLRWRCRRGMLELDIILNEFIDGSYDSLDTDGRQLLDELLDYPDQLLLDLLLGNVISSDKHIAELVNAIRRGLKTMVK